MTTPRGPRRPVLLVVVSFMFALLYWASPNARQGFRWVTPGGVLAVVERGRAIATGHPPDAEPYMELRDSL